MGTYAEIQAWIKSEFGFSVKTCWIAHCKELYGLARKDAPNRKGVDRMYPCPPDKQAAIAAAFRHFKLMA